jgi:4-amino-4-deoxy-L-arabinose transferase-like glycosyltransferase
MLNSMDATIAPATDTHPRDSLLLRMVQVVKRQWPFIFVIVLACTLRLYALDLIDVRYDEASAPQLALGIARGQLLAVAPFSGSVANHPPFFLYLLSLPYRFTTDILFVAAYRALLDVAALVLLWWLCERFFNRRVALIAILLFAVAPWAIQYSRKLSIVTPAICTVILLFGLIEVLSRKNPWGWAVAGFGLALSIGSHLTAIYLVPVVAIALLLGWRTLRPIPLLVGLLPVTALIALYLGADAGHDFANIRALLATTQQAATVNLDALNIAFWSSGGAHLSDLTDGAYPIWQAQVPTLFGWIDTLQMALLATGLVYVIYTGARSILRRNWRTMAVYLVLLVWWCVPVGLQLRHNQAIQMHYLLPLYPVPFVVMALFLDRAIGLRKSPRAIPRMISLLALTIGILIVGWQVFTTLRFDQFVARYDTSVGGYGPPVQTALQVAGMARDQKCQPSCSDGVIVVAPGGDPRVNEQATVFDVVLAGTPHRFDNADAGLILRPDNARYIFTPGSDRALHELLIHVPASSVVSHTVTVRNGSQSTYTYVYVNQPSISGFTQAPQVQFANGTALQGYRSNIDSALGLQVLLQVAKVPAGGSDYHWFNHVLSGGEKIAQLDGGGVHPSNWREGDLLLQWFDIPLPVPAPPNLSVRIGSYTYPGLQPVPVTYPDGQVSDGVTVNLK